MATRQADVFISHTSEDNDYFVEPLARQLRINSIDPWFDGYEIQAGDDIVDKIEEGLANCLSGLLVITPNFLAKKGWTETEMRALVDKFVQNPNRLFAILASVSIDEFKSKYPLLASKIAIVTDNPIKAAAEFADSYWTRVVPE